MKDQLIRGQCKLLRTIREIGGMVGDVDAATLGQESKLGYFSIHKPYYT